jgi:alkylresorcinol/alkylpyrone synthase
MYFTGLGTAVPPRSFTQRECWDALQRADRPEITARTRAILQGILTHDNGIERRSLALDNLDEGFDLDPDTLHRRFVKNAPALASEAGRRALADAKLTAAEIDAVVVSTCTGYLCPGLTSYVAEALGLRRDAVHLDLVGQGCGAALPNLRTAEALVASRRADHVLSICVEVCSAAFYLDDDLGVLVSACLFGDGAGAAVLSASPRAEARRVQWKSAASLNAPEHRDALRFEQRGGMLRNILTLPVPKLAADHARRLLDTALADAGLARRDIDGWVMHAGGRRVLEELKSRLGLDSADVGVSAALLSKYGNLSSPFVLFVLQEALREGRPGGTWWMSSFGAGFSCHGALLEVA